MKDYIVARLKEASTYRGIVLCLTAFGVILTPEQSEAVVVIGLFIAGLLGAAIPDTDKELYESR